MYASSQGHSEIDQDPPRSTGRHRRFVLLRAWRGHCQEELVNLFARVASWFPRARVTRVLGARGGIGDATRAGLFVGAR